MGILGEYFVVGVDIEQYDPQHPGKYLRDLLKEENDVIAQRGFQSYLGVLPSPPIGFDNFTREVNSYMERPPFNYPNPLISVGGHKMVSTSNF